MAAAEAIFDYEEPPRIVVNLWIFRVSLISLQSFDCKWMNSNAGPRIYFDGKSAVINSKCSGRFIMNSHCKRTCFTQRAKANKNERPITNIANQNSYLGDFAEMWGILETHATDVEI